MRLYLGLLPLVAACVVPSLEPWDKRCPCAEGWTCDQATQRCVPFEAPQDGGAPLPPTVQVRDLRPTWSTAQSIRWEWTASGDPGELGTYEIAVGTTEEMVRSRTVGLRIYDKDDNPELGRFAGRDKIPQSASPGLWSVTDELPLPGTTYFAQVTAVDKEGRRSSTEIVSAATTAPTQELVIFTEDAMPGTSSPTTFDRTTDRPYKGKYCYGDKIGCKATEASCFAQVQRSGLGKSLSALDQKTFGGAFLEIAVAGDVAIPDYYSDLSLSFGSAPCDPMGTGTCRWHYTGWTFRGGAAYRVIAVPLRALSAGSSPLSLDDIVTRGGKLTMFALSGTWKASGFLRVDEIRLRW